MSIVYSFSRSAVTKNDQLGGFKVTEIDCHCAGGQWSETGVSGFVLPGGLEEEFVSCPPPTFGWPSVLGVLWLIKGAPRPHLHIHKAFPSCFFLCLLIFYGLVFVFNSTCSNFKILNLQRLFSKKRSYL